MKTDPSFEMKRSPIDTFLTVIMWICFVTGTLILGMAIEKLLNY